MEDPTQTAKNENGVIRRDFITKAALPTAGLAIGQTAWLKQKTISL